VAIKNIVIPLEVEYLHAAAKERGISRSRLVRFVMEKVVNDKLVSSILGEDDLSKVEARPQKYRRFRNRVSSRPGKIEPPRDGITDGVKSL
jgi:hypothetical protein